MADASAHVRLLARDLSEPHARYDARSQQFQLLLRGATSSLAFSHVRVLGICTSVTRSEQSCSLELGTVEQHMRSSIDW